MHNSSMETNILTKIKKAFHGFKECQSNRCNGEFLIALDEWVEFFTQSEARQALIVPNFKSKRLRRINDNEPWTIENLQVIEPARAKPGARKPDDDGTTYRLLTVDDWLSEIRQAI